MGCTLQGLFHGATFPEVVDEGGIIIGIVGYGERRSEQVVGCALPLGQHLNASLLTGVGNKGFEVHARLADGIAQLGSGHEIAVVRQRGAGAGPVGTGVIRRIGQVGFGRESDAVPAEGKEIAPAGVLLC